VSDNSHPAGSLGPKRITSRQAIESVRGPKAAVSLDRPAGACREWEPTSGARRTPPTMAEVTSVFLVGAECAMRCTMCDLWRHTLDHPTPVGALPRQLAWGLRNAKWDSESARLSPESTLSSERWVKLYNASNFLDPRSVPIADWPKLAQAIAPFDRVIVENHPRVRPRRAAEFARMIEAKLEVAVGLEAADDEILLGLNKRMTLADFVSATERWHEEDIDVRAFVLLAPPGTEPAHAVSLAIDTLRFAERHGVRHASVIPTRGSNSLLDALAPDGRFVPPTAGDLEATLAAALQLRFDMVVTADLWDWDGLRGHCETCREARRARLQRMNLTQRGDTVSDADCRCSKG